MRRAWTPALLVLALTLGALSAWWYSADRASAPGGPTPDAASQAAPAPRALEIDPRVAAADAAAKASSTATTERTQAAAADDTTLGRVSGAVRRPDGSPVVGAKVIVQDEAAAGADDAEGASAATDDEGRYALGGLAPGVYRIVAEAPGLRGDTREGVAVEAGEETAGIDLTLDPGARILGLVRAVGDGRLLAGVTVRVHDRTALSGRRVSQANELRTRPPERSAKTGEDGRFEVRGLAPGSKLVTAKASGFKTSAQVAVELAEGQAQTIELAVEQGLFIAGLVTDPQSAPVSGARVEAEPARARGPFGGTRTTDEGGKATTGTDGRYRIDGLSGARFAVTARASGRGLAEARKNRVRPGRSDVDLQLTAGASISGRVVAAGTGAPVAGAEVRAKTGRFGMGGRTSTRSGPDGIFELGELREGSYEVEARATGRAPASQTVELKAGDGRKEVTLTLAADGRVSGMVVDKATGLPVAGARVIGLPDGNPMQQRMGRMLLEASAAPGGLQGGTAMFQAVAADLTEATRTTGPDGTFVLDGLEEGGYLVAAADATHPAGEARAQVKAGEETKGIRIELPPAGTLRGTVKDAAGQAVAGASISAFSMSGGLRSGETDDQGQFEIAGLRAGSFMVNVRVADDANVPGTFRGQNVDIEAGREARVDLRAELNVKVRARAVRAEEPVADTRVMVLAQAGGMLFRNARTDEAGLFEIELPPGAYLFRVGSYSQTVRVPATDDVVDVLLAIPGLHARGQVIDAQGGAPLAAEVTLYRKQPGQAADTFAAVLGAQAGQARASKETGAFDIGQLGPGTYVLATRLDGYGEERVDVTVPEGGDLEGVVVALEPGMVLSGLVVDPEGKPVPRPTAWVRDSSAPSVPGGRPPTGDGDGRFRLDRLSAGSYILTVLSEAYAPWRQAIAVTDGQPEQIIDIHVTKGGSIDVTFTRSGQPAVGARVEIRYPDGDRVVTSFADFIQSYIPTNAEGQVRRSRMPPGTLHGTVYLSGSGEQRLAEARFVVEVQEGQETAVTIDLPGE